MSKSTQTELEQEIEKIYNQVQGYYKEDKIEELTYLLGVTMGTLRNLGFPITHKALERMESKIDTWANKLPKRGTRKNS